MDWITYANDGATRNLPLSPDLVNALAFLPEMGLGVEVFSGGQPAIGTSTARVGSTRHDHGNAADVFFTRDGQRMSWADPGQTPIFQEIVRRGRERGLTGFGAGEGYMSPGSMHIGFGAPAVWGAGGSSENAPDWLRQAYYGTEAGPTPSGLYDPTRPPSVFNNPSSNSGGPSMPGANPMEQRMNALAMLEQFQPRANALNAGDFMAQPYSNQLISIMGA